jgi:ribonuclease P protein component
MLPRSERLARSRLFQQVYAGKKKVTTDLLMLYVLPKKADKKNSSYKQTKVAFVIKKNLCKNAVDRNRAKRRVIGAYKIVKTQLLDTGKLNWQAIVWIINEKTLTATWDEVKTTVLNCLTQANEKYT